MSTTKQIATNVTIDLDQSRPVWEHGVGDQRVQLWADAGAQHVWIETNGDPVTDAEDIVIMLVERAVPPPVARSAADGNFAGLSFDGGWLAPNGRADELDWERGDAADFAGEDLLD